MTSRCAATLLVLSSVTFAAVTRADDRQRTFMSYRERLDRILAAEQLAAQAPSGAPAGLADSAPAPSRCGLYAPGAATASADSCRDCHQSTYGVSKTHPVDVDYDSARYKPNASALRPSHEVVKRGVFLPDGKVRCGTCHDARSPWKYHLAIPPGAEIRAAVRLHQPATYEDDRPAPVAPAGLTALPARGAAMAPGSDVSPTPLCRVCHSFD